MPTLTINKAPATTALWRHDRDTLRKLSRQTHETIVRVIHAAVDSYKGQHHEYTGPRIQTHCGLWASDKDALTEFVKANGGEVSQTMHSIIEQYARKINSLKPKGPS